MGGFQGGVTHQGGLSVYASGYMVGSKLSESFMGPAGADGLLSCLVFGLLSCHVLSSL